MQSKPGTATIIDFDHTSTDHAKAWPATYRALRSDCPHGWSASHGGYWVATRYKDVVSVAQCPAIATEKIFDVETGQWRGGNVIPPLPVQPVLPVEAHNDAWRGYRSLLNRRFSPTMAEGFRPVAAAAARTLIDQVVETGRLDFVDDLTNPVPAIVTMKMFGFETADWVDFAEPIHRAMYYRPDNPDFANVVAKLAGITDRIMSATLDRRKNPTDDLMSYIANGEIDGRQLTADEVTQMAINIIFGGVDTTTALTSNVLRYLGRNPAQRQRLIDDPALRPIAREESVRFFAPVHGVARHSTEDVAVGGFDIKAGESVFLAIASANRDGAVFDDPDEFKIDRRPNRHIGFGAGMHHCIGLFIARVMFDAMLDEVLDRIPDYVMGDGEKPYSSVDKVNGWISLPATFSPGRKLGGGMVL